MAASGSECRRGRGSAPPMRRSTNAFAFFSCLYSTRSVFLRCRARGVNRCAVVYVSKFQRTDPHLVYGFTASLVDVFRR